MGLLGDLKGPLVGIAASTLLFVVVALVGLFDVLATLTSPSVTLAGLLLAALPYAVGLVVLGAVGLACVVWAMYRVATGQAETTSRWLKNDTTVALAKLLERENEYARRLDLAEKLEPDAEQRRKRDIEQLKADYADGKLTEAEFERELERLIERGDADGRRATRERDRLRHE